MNGNATRATRHSLRNRKDDFYATPRAAVEALMRIERLPQSLWDPCCGDGAIVLPLREAGHDVYASDLNDFGCPGAESGHDFLMPFPVPRDVDGIVMNPPFKLIRPFIEKGLACAPYIAMLARLAYLESAGRKAWFEDSPLARVHVSSRRLPMMHRHGWAKNKSSSAIAFAWFVFERGRRGRPEIHWFDWREAASRAAGSCVARTTLNSENENAHQPS